MRTLIGKGIKFPYSATQQRGVEFSESIERINHSLFLIFETPKGTRLFQPDFGSDLYTYRFDPFDDILITKLRNTIMSDIQKWEPRVVVNDIKFYDSPEARDNHTLYVSIDYRIINTEVVGNFVYPYKLEVYDTSRDDLDY